MDIMSISILVGFFLIGLGIGHYTSLKSKAKKDYYYWRGRGDGWRACEDMVIERAKEKNYGEAWIDLLQ
jgi:hypothetical protein